MLHQHDETTRQVGMARESGMYVGFPNLIDFATSFFELIMAISIGVAKSINLQVMRIREGTSVVVLDHDLNIDPESTPPLT